MIRNFNWLLGFCMPAFLVLDSCFSAGFAENKSGSDQSPIELPAGRDVENVGAGWPANQALPLNRLAPIPPAQLKQLELRDAVLLSDQRNPVVRQSYEQLVATQNSLGAAYATWWPVVNASINGGMYGQTAYYNYIGALSGVGSPATGPFANTTAFNSSYFQSLSQFDIAWNLIDPARAPLIWQNKYKVRQAADAYIISRRDNRLRTEQAYVNLQTAVAQIVTSQKLVENDRLLYSLAESRVRLGVSSRLDLYKQQTVLKADQVNLVNAQQSAQVAQADLAELLNEASYSQIWPSTSLAPFGSWSHSLDSTLASAFSYRKVIEQKLMDVKINEAQAKIDLSVYRPTISLVNTLYWTKGVGYTGLGPAYVGDARSDLWDGSALLQITFTGFDGGQARMSAASAMRRAKAAEADSQSAVNQVRREVQTYFSQVSQGKDATVLASQRVTSATQALRLQTLRFKAGYGNITDVVQAQQDLTQAVTLYVQQLSSYNVALVSLARASGLAYSADPAFLKLVGDPLSKISLLREEVKVK